MTLVAEYRDAHESEHRARVRRILALRAMSVVGMTQRQVAARLGVSQSAVSQQLSHGVDTAGLPLNELVRLAAPVLRELASSRGFTRLSVFGSVARDQARVDSDVDLIVQAPETASIRDVLRLRADFAEVLGRSVDLITYGSLRSGIDDDIVRDLVPL